MVHLYVAQSAILFFNPKAEKIFFFVPIIKVIAIAICATSTRNALTTAKTENGVAFFVIPFLTLFIIL